MVQRFYNIPVDGNQYLCDYPSCMVVIFICAFGGVCPLCFEIGKRVGNQNYPEV